MPLYRVYILDEDGQLEGVLNLDDANVLKIAPFSVQVEDIPYQNAQPLPLTQN